MIGLDNCLLLMDLINAKEKKQKYNKLILKNKRFKNISGNDNVKSVLIKSKILKKKKKILEKEFETKIKNSSSSSKHSKNNINNSNKFNLKNNINKCNTGSVLNNKNANVNDKKKSKKSVLLRNICHKDSVGCNNWKKFIEMEGKSDKINCNDLRHAKLPLMKSSIDNTQQNKFNSKFLNNNNSNYHKRPNQKAKLTKCVALDCEMVGVGEEGAVSMLARVSMVNSFGDCIYDKYVKPTETVTDYRTFVSGIRPHNIENGEDFFKVQQEVANMLKGRTLIGHAIKHDLEVLFLRHPWKFIRDTITFLKFRNESKSTLSLKNLAKDFLNVKIQEGEHDSVEDAKAAMQLYMTFRKEWELERRAKVMSQRNQGAKKQSRPPPPLMETVEMI